MHVLHMSQFKEHTSSLASPPQGHTTPISSHALHADVPTNLCEALLLRSSVILGQCAFFTSLGLHVNPEAIWNCVFETRSHCVALASLELSMQTRLKLVERCLPLPPEYCN